MTEDRQFSKLTLNEMVVDKLIFPRQGVSRAHADALMDALRAGATLPPIVLDAESKRIIDGMHRYTAQRNLYGPGMVVDVELRRYASIVAMFVDAVKLNASHGLRLADEDVRICLARAKALNLDTADLAASLSVPRSRLPGDLPPLEPKPGAPPVAATTNGARQPAAERPAPKPASANPRNTGARPAEPSAWRGDDDLAGYVVELCGELDTVLSTDGAPRRPAVKAALERVAAAVEGALRKQ